MTLVLQPTLIHKLGADEDNAATWNVHFVSASANLQTFGKKASYNRLRCGRLRHGLLSACSEAEKAHEARSQLSSQQIQASQAGLPLFTPSGISLFQLYTRTCTTCLLQLHQIGGLLLLTSPSTLAVQEVLTSLLRRRLDRSCWRDRAACSAVPT